jgi:hypothetical protein
MKNDIGGREPVKQRIRHALAVVVLAAGASSSGAQEHADDVYFGDMHVHTRYSNDAFAFMTDRSPDDAYRFAKGEPLAHYGSSSIKLQTPLDFLAVTDHAENLGVLQSFLDPNHPQPQDPAVRMARSEDAETRFQAFYEWRKAVAADADTNTIFDDPEATASAWQEIVASADRHYTPGSFTTFAAFEWTASINRGNLHRNVIFAQTSDLPLPLPAGDNIPETLWSYMELHRRHGVDSLAIPHNPNVSDGRMFAHVDSYGEPLTANYAARRNWNEPLVEITQNKGTSETHPALSSNDEFADFELFTELLVSDGKQGKLHGSYVREALISGVQFQQEQGFNPFMPGLIGASDFHSGTSAVEENNMSGMYGATRGATPEQRRNVTSVVTTPFHYRGASGLTAVWAPENTREALFSALRRREVYATTGTRLRVRFFAGWDYPENLPDRDERTSVGYAGGVPMGRILHASANASDERSPRFLVWAEKDPNSGNLDRIQIIKGWTDNGKGHEKVYNVALSDGRVVAADGSTPVVGNTVDPVRATYSNDIGDASLAALWEDPDFDPAQQAFYYARVLEIPTPRWTTYDAAALGVEVPEGVPASIQERAYTSPVWYQP